MSCTTALLLVLAWMAAPAIAQPADACKKLDEALVVPAGTAMTANLSDATLSVLNDLASKPPQIVAKLNGHALAGPGIASVSFEDAKIAALTDVSRLCVRAFIPIGDKKWKPVTVRQIFLSDKFDDKVKRLNVAFDVDTPESATLVSPSSNITYLLAGVFLDAAPAASATVFGYEATLRVTSHWCSTILTLVFVAVFYGFIAWATYDAEDADDLKGIPWLIYVLSPIRISAAWYGEASMSQVQVLLFTFIVAGLLFHLWMTTQALSDISTDLLKLLGISAVGAAGAKFTQTLKVSLKDETARYLIGKGWYDWKKIPGRNHATIGYLLLTDGRLDVYKFQIAIFTLVVACYVLTAGQANLGDVKISETMLYLIGISQGVYVGGKAVTDRTTDLEQAVKKMMDLEDEIDKLTAAVPAPAQLADKLSEYAKAAKVAAREFEPLYKREYPRDPNNTKEPASTVLTP